MLPAFMGCKPSSVIYSFYLYDYQTGVPNTNLNFYVSDKIMRRGGHLKVNSAI